MYVKKIRQCSEQPIRGGLIRRDVVTSGWFLICCIALTSFVGCVHSSKRLSPTHVLPADQRVEQPTQWTEPYRTTPVAHQEPVTGEESLILSPVARDPHTAFASQTLSSPEAAETAEQNVDPMALAADPNRPLRLVDLEAIALRNNPSIGRAEASVLAARGRWVQVGLKPNPVVGYLGDEIGIEGTSGQQGAYVSQQFITANKLQLSRSVVEQEIAAAQNQLATQRQRTLTDVRKAYVNVLLAQRKIRIARELVEINEQAVKASQALLQGMEISRVELLQAQVEAQETTILLQRAENENLAAWRELAAVLGTPEMEPRTIQDELQKDAPVFDWQSTLNRLLEISPEVAQARALVDRARWALDRAVAQAVPNVQAQVSTRYVEATSDTVAGVQIGVPIPIYNWNQGGISEAQAAIVQNERNVQRVQLNLQSRLAVAFRAYETARFQVDKYADQILPQAQQTLELVSSGYELGEINYLTMLTSQRTFSQTNLAYLASLRELWQAIADIDGLLLNGSLNPPS